MDQAGLTSDVQTFSFFVESRGPYITVPDHWQVGQTISLSVQANSFSLGSVSIVVSDPQQRWPDVEQVYPASGDSFTTDFHWDGRFNGQTAPAGQYTVSVYASDVMSNLSVSHSQVTVPVVIPTAVPTLTATGTTAAAESTAAATATPQPSSTPTAAAGVPVTSFSSPASPATQPAATLPSNVLWGGAAAAVIGAATAAALEAARKRKEEEEAQRQAAEAAAAQFNAAEKVIDAQIAANQIKKWQDQQKAEAEAKEKEQEALNDAYQSFKQADQQSMQEYKAYQEKLREAEIKSFREADAASMTGYTEYEYSNVDRKYSNLSIVNRVFLTIFSAPLIASGLNNAKNDFTKGFFEEILRLSPDSYNSTSNIFGRVVADLAITVIGIGGVFGGAEIAAGLTVVSCGTTLCLGAAVTIPAGIAVGVAGVSAIYVGANNLGKNIQLFSQKSNSNGNNGSYILQSGDHILSRRVWEGLGLSQDEAKQAIEALKKANRLSHDSHFTIMSNGDYIGPNGEIIDNIYDYLP